MNLDPWTRRPVPTATGPEYHLEIDRPAQLRGLRAALRSWLRGTSDADAHDKAVVEALLLAVEELASNGLRHGGAPVSVTVVRGAGGLLLDIGDDDPLHGPRSAVGRDPALGGMGLPMVAQVTDVRGWTTVRGRKHVWARIPTHELSVGGEVGSSAGGP
jgi:anti-sigma regulatory factor (Ser/Thr protein kinase)